MSNKASKAKGTKAKAKKAPLRDLKAARTDATKGGTTSSTRFDPYKNFKFRP